MYIHMYVCMYVYTDIHTYTYNILSHPGILHFNILLYLIFSYFFKKLRIKYQNSAYKGKPEMK